MRAPLPRTQGRRRPHLRPRARRDLRRGPLRQDHARGGGRNGAAPEGGRGHDRVGRRNVQDLVRDLRQGPLRGVQRRQSAQRAGGPEDVPVVSSTAGRRGRNPAIRAAHVHWAGALQGAGGARARHRQPPGRDAAPRRGARLYERGLARRHLLVPAERPLPEPRGLPAGPRRRHARGVPAPSWTPGWTCSWTARTSPCRGTCCLPTSATRSSSGSPKRTWRRSTARSTASTRPGCASISAGATTRGRTSATSPWTPCSRP